MMKFQAQKHIIKLEKFIEDIKFKKEKIKRLDNIIKMVKEQIKTSKRINLNNKNENISIDIEGTYVKKMT